MQQFGFFMLGFSGIGTFFGGILFLFCCMSVCGLGFLFCFPPCGFCLYRQIVYISGRMWGFGLCG